MGLHRVRNRPLLLRVYIFDSLATGGIAAILFTPLVKSSIADVHLVADLIDFGPSIRLLKCKGNFLFSESAFFQGMYPFPNR